MKEQMPVARLQIEVSDRPYTLGESYFGIVILDRERCADEMLLYAAAPAAPVAAPAPSEPRGWLVESSIDTDFTNDPELAAYWKRKGRKVEALYAAPDPYAGITFDTDDMLTTQEPPCANT